VPGGKRGGAAEFEISVEPGTFSTCREVLQESYKHREKGPARCTAAFIAWFHRGPAARFSPFNFSLRRDAALLIVRFRRLIVFSCRPRPLFFARALRCLCVSLSVCALNRVFVLPTEPVIVQSANFRTWQYSTNPFFRSPSLTIIILLNDITGPDLGPPVQGTPREGGPQVGEEGRAGQAPLPGGDEALHPHGGPHRRRTQEGEEGTSTTIRYAN